MAQVPDYTADAKVCPTQGNHTVSEENKREEDRILRNITQRHGVVKQTPIKGDFYLHLEGLPAEKGQPVTVKIDGKEVYSSGDLSGDASAALTIPHEPGRRDLELRLSIPVMGFDNAVQVNKVEGCYYKFKGSERGLERFQQPTPFK